MFSLFDISGCEGGSEWEVGDEMLKFGESVDSVFEESGPLSASISSSSSFCSVFAQVQPSSFGSAAPWSCPAGLGSAAAGPSRLGAVEVGVGHLSCE